MSSAMIAPSEERLTTSTAIFMPHCRTVSVTLVSCVLGHCFDPWQQRKVRIIGSKVQIEGEQVIKLSPTCTADRLTQSALSALVDWAWMLPGDPPSPPGAGVMVQLSVPDHGRWAFSSATADEHERLLAALRDAIDLSHGADSPYARWAFGETLGQGTFGTVRAAQSRTTGERVAVKVLSLVMLDRMGDAKQAVERERSMMQKLMDALPPRAPLVRLLEMHTYGGNLFFFLTPRCEGDLLGLLQRGPFHEAAAAAATRGVLLAIAALHRAGLVHLDVKPQNLLYRTIARGTSSHTRFDLYGMSLELFLADFGCARPLVRGGTSELPAARGGWRALRNDGGGTLYFTPPEVLEENVQATSADVWAAGCVAFSLLHRRPPFVYDGEKDELVRLRILRAVPLYEPKDGSSGKDGKPLAPLTPAARACLASLLKREWQQRPSAEEALKEPWVAAAVSKQHQLQEPPPPVAAASHSQASFAEFEVDANWGD